MGQPITLTPEDWRTLTAEERDVAFQDPGAVSTWTDIWEWRWGACDSLWNFSDPALQPVELCRGGSESTAIICIDKTRNRTVVVKMPPCPSNTDFDTAYLRSKCRSLQSEASVLRTLKQQLPPARRSGIPHLVGERTLTVEPYGQIPVLITEYIPNLTSLRTRLRQCANIEEAVILFQRACLAVDLIHQAGFVHGDLHLKNLYLRGDQIVVLDFGSAEAITRRQGRMPYERHTRPPGFLQYIAEARGDQPLSPEFDIAVLSAHFVNQLRLSLFPNEADIVRQTDSREHPQSTLGAQYMRLRCFETICTAPYPPDRPANMQQVIELAARIPAGPAVRFEETAGTRLVRRIRYQLSRSGHRLILAGTVTATVVAVALSMMFAQRSSEVAAVEAVNSEIANLIAMTTFEQLRRQPPDDDWSDDLISKLELNLPNIKTMSTGAKASCCSQLLAIAVFKMQMRGYGTAEKLIMTTGRIAAREKGVIFRLLTAECSALQARSLAYSCSQEQLPEAIRLGEKALKVLEEIPTEKLSPNECAAFRRVQFRLAWDTFRSIEKRLNWSGTTGASISRLLNLDLPPARTSEEEFWLATVHTTRAYFLHKCPGYLGFAHGERKRPTVECRALLRHALQTIGGMKPGRRIESVWQSHIDDAELRARWILTMSLTNGSPPDQPASVREGSVAFDKAKRLLRQYPGQWSLLRTCISTGWDLADAYRSIYLESLDRKVLLLEIGIRRQVMKFAKDVLEFDEDLAVHEAFRVNGIRLAYAYFRDSQFQNCAETMHDVESHVGVFDLTRDHSSGYDSLVCITVWAHRQPNQIAALRFTEQLQVILSRHEMGLRLDSAEIAELSALQALGFFDVFNKDLPLNSLVDVIVRRSARQMPVPPLPKIEQLHNHHEH